MNGAARRHLECEHTELVMPFEFEANFVESLNRCMRRQLWTVIIAMVVAIVAFSAIWGGLLAAFGRETGATIASFVFSAIAVGAACVNTLRRA